MSGHEETSKQLDLCRRDMKANNKTEESFKCFLKHILQEHSIARGTESSTLAVINT